MKLGGGGEPCTLCQKTVYPAERQKTANGCYHVKCFSCTKCKRQLQQSNFVEDAATGRLYCRTHYAQLAKEAGLSKVAAGGVDESAGVLVVKKTKQEVAEEVDTLVVGSSVWVELGVDKAGEKLAERAENDEPFVRATVTRVGEDSIGVKSASGAQVCARRCITRCISLCWRSPRASHSKQPRDKRSPTAQRSYVPSGRRLRSAPLGSHLWLSGRHATPPRPPRRACVGQGEQPAVAASQRAQCEQMA